MDTHLKQTPLPIPSLAFLAKNFSDGTREIDDNSSMAPTFGSLGLANDLEIEPFDKSSARLRLHEKQKQREVQIFIFYLIIYPHFLFIASTIFINLI